MSTVKRDSGTLKVPDLEGNQPKKHSLFLGIMAIIAAVAGIVLFVVLETKIPAIIAFCIAFVMLVLYLLLKKKPVVPVVKDGRAPLDAAFATLHGRALAHLTEGFDCQLLPPETILLSKNALLPVATASTVQLSNPGSDPLIVVMALNIRPKA
jgi:uncharacterized membrane protein YfcA